MKYKLLIISLIFVSFSALAQEDLSKKAEAYYAEQNYQAAAEIYDSLMLLGTSPYLYYNYANTQFKLNNIGKAILFYEKALVLAPNDEDIKSSLEFANTFTADKIDSYETFFLVEWLSYIGKIFNTNQWAILAIILFIISLILFLMYLFSSVLSIRKITFFVSCMSFVLALISFIYSFSERKYLVDNPYAIVMDGSVSIKASPTFTGKELFVLHEGTKINVIDKKEGWSKIKIADKRVGWLPQKSIEGI